MTNLKNILTIAGLGLITSLNAQTPEKRDSIYNNKGQLERVIIERENDTLYFNYKYDNNGKLVQWIRKRKAGTEKSDYKYDEKGRKIEEIYNLNWEHQKLKEEKLYEYDEHGKHSKTYFKIENNGKIQRQVKIENIYDPEGKFLKKIFQFDENGDDIYEEENECTCGNKKEAIL